MVDTRSNEIAAIPELLDMLALEGTVVTIDAMGTQKAIAGKIIERSADYVLALKSLPRTRRGGTVRGPQPALLQQAAARSPAARAPAR